MVFSMGKKKAPTIYNVAQVANVSPGTVSRYINNVGTPRKDTKERLDSAIKQLRFVPNSAAQALKSGRSNIICLFYPKTEDPFYSRLVVYLSAGAKEAGYTLLSCQMDGSDNELQLMPFMKEGIMDGLILINLNLTSKHRDLFYSTSIPLVIGALCVSPYGGTDLDNYDYVGVDGRNALYLSTSHMISQGHQNIAFAAGNQKMIVFRECYEGYYSAMLKYNLSPSPSNIFFDCDSKDSGYEVGEIIANMDPTVRPTAICTTSDVVAIGIISAFRKHGLSVPEDVAVIGMGNIYYDEDIVPSLSSVSMSAQELSKYIIDLEIKRIADIDTPAKKIILLPELRIRDSSQTVKEPAHV